MPRGYGTRPHDGREQGSREYVRPSKIYDGPRPSPNGTTFIRTIRLQSVFNSVLDRLGAVSAPVRSCLGIPFPTVQNPVRAPIKTVSMPASVTIDRSPPFPNGFMEARFHLHFFYKIKQHRHNELGVAQSLY